MKWLLLFISLAGTAHAQMINDLARRQLRGSVKSLTEIESDYKDESDRFPHRWSTTYNYDRQGNLMKISHYAEFVLNEYSIFTKTGNEVTEKNYDSKGKLVRTYKTICDNKGKAIFETEFMPDGKVAGRSFWKYDANGNITEGVENTRSVALAYTCTYVYDEYNKMTKMEKKASNDNFSSFTTYYYDKNGNKTDEQDFTNDMATKIKRTYKYDTGNNLIETDYLSPGDTTSHLITKYADYDHCGNWIKETNYNGAQLAVYERQIAYY